MDVITDCSRKKSSEQHGTPMEPFHRPFVFRSKAEQRMPTARAEGDCHVSIGTIILIILVIALLGGFSGIGGGPFYGTGYYGGGGLGLIIVILLILLLLGRL
jgi:uncharacterized protein DUF3309